MDTVSDNGNWYSVVESLEKLSVSRGTLYDWIRKEELNTKKDGKNRLVWIDDSIIQKSTKPSTNENSELKSQIVYFRNKVDKLETELSEQRNRHDSIILTLSQQNQLLLHQQNQLLLQNEKEKKPFWSRWFM
ncbi:MAG: hypothetical protein CMB97_08465 [Flavobacteriaceae bacterium]|nr:hypothetical protein [Flavobacteriaceae bacterium]